MGIINIKVEHRVLEAQSTGIACLWKDRLKEAELGI